MKKLRLIALLGLLATAGACADMPTAVNADEEPTEGRGIVGPEGRGIVGPEGRG